MPQKHVVQLGDGDRHQLQSLLRSGRSSARALTRARVLPQPSTGQQEGAPPLTHYPTSKWPPGISPKGPSNHYPIYT